MHLLWLLIKSFFWIIIFVSLLTTLVSYFVFWMELRLVALAANQPLKISWLTFIKNMLIEFLCLVMNCFLFPFGDWILPRKKPTITDQGVPVLFVHGYLDHRNVWLWFIYQLQKKEGFGPCFRVNLFPAFSSISVLAENLKAKIHEILEKTGSNQIILVGHSMGGLVCSYYSEFLAKPNEVARVITLATPFAGSKLAALGFGQNAQEMAPHSPFLTELSGRVQQSTIPYYLILSKMDNMVIPWNSALLFDETVRNVMILEDYGHFRLLISRPIIDQVAKWITV